MGDIVVIVKVRNLLPALRKSYGEFRHIEISKAVKGQHKGYWEIVGGDGEKELCVIPRSILDDVYDDTYMARMTFKPKAENPLGLSYKDVYGMKTRPA